jgi:hypothetical protein
LDKSARQPAGRASSEGHKIGKQVRKKLRASTTEKNGFDEECRVFDHHRRRNEIDASRFPANSAPAFMPSIISASIIGICILLSTLIGAVGTRYVGFEGASDETAWLVDRLTGNVYKCHAAESGKASCEDQTTASVRQPKR